jgi:hypothetical protein
MKPRRQLLATHCPRLRRVRHQLGDELAQQWRAEVDS